jgi:plasmid stability protein
MASFQSAKLLRINLGDEQLKALERLAARQGRSVEEFINDALRRYLSREATR